MKIKKSKIRWWIRLRVKVFKLFKDTKLCYWARIIADAKVIETRAIKSL